MTDENYVLTTFGELQEGDVILDENGNPVEVSKAYDPHTPERMYALTMENGLTVEASGNHLWYIEPPEDIASHQSRLIKAKSTLSDAPSRLLEGLEEIAELEEPYEVTLLDIVDLFDYKLTADARAMGNYDEESYFLVSRVLQSIGHIVEYNEVKQDLSTGETAEQETTLLYDGRRVAQQLLSLTGRKQWKKRWPAIVGRVVTTDAIFEAYRDADIPSLSDMKQPLLQRWLKSKAS